MCETYETEDNVTEEFCENDLQLAAELGKALLERNRELEAQLQQQQHMFHEQSLQLQHVTKQLESFRSTSESRNRAYEEMDRISQELEQQNNKLCMDAKADHQKIERLTGTVEVLEQKLEDLLRQLEEARKTKDNKTGQAIWKEKRRTASLASLDKSQDKMSFYMGDLAWTQTAQFKNMPLNPLEAEFLKLQDTLQHVRGQCTSERHKREDLEVYIDVCEQENRKLQKKVMVLEERLSEAMVLEYELEQAKHCTEGVCRNCRKALELPEGPHLQEASLLSEVEHDDDPLLISQAKVVKLEGGQCLYGSSESISKVSADACEIKESKSILDELETQYKSLFEKYESLINSKNKRLNQPMQTDEESAEEQAIRRRLAHKEVQTLLHVTLSRDFSQDTQPPPYRALFDDLFATLRKARHENAKPNNGISASQDTL